MAVEIGINPITWTNDDMPELGGDIPLETCLAETRQAGYSGTELGGKFPRISTELGPILQRHGLKLISGWYDGRICEREVDQEFAAIEPHLTLLRDLGCQVVVYADTSRGRHDGIFQPASRRPVLPMRNGAITAARSPRSPSVWLHSASAWHSITTWEPSSRRTPKLIGSWRRPARRLDCCMIRATACSPAVIPRRCSSGTSRVLCMCIARMRDAMCWNGRWPTIPASWMPC